IVAALLLAILVGLLVVMSISGNPPGSPVTDTDAVKPFELVDTQGKTITQRDLTGKWSLLFFGFSRCPDVCPTTLIDMGHVLEQIGPLADALQPVFISVDPEWDTQERMKTYMGNFDPRIIGLTGSMEQVREAAKNYSVFFRKVPLDGGGYTVDHSAALYLLDPNGKYVRPYSWQDGADVLAEKLSAVMKET
ncbi:MAG: SCO family protein, partial [Rhodospirillaceae bacterium]